MKEKINNFYKIDITEEDLKLVYEFIDNHYKNGDKIDMDDVFMMLDFDLKYLNKNFYYVKDSKTNILTQKVRNINNIHGY